MEAYKWWYINWDYNLDDIVSILSVPNRTVLNIFSSEQWAQEYNSFFLTKTLKKNKSILYLVFSKFLKISLTGSTFWLLNTMSSRFLFISFCHSLLFQTLCRRPSILQIYLSDLVTPKSRKFLKTCILNHLKRLCWRQMLSTDTPESYARKVYFIEHRERLKWLAQRKSVPRCRPSKPQRWIYPPSNDSLTLISTSGSTGRRLTLQWLVNKSKRKIEPL